MGFKIKYKRGINKKYISTDARKLKKKLSIKQWKKLGVILPENKSKI